MNNCVCGHAAASHYRQGCLGNATSSCNCKDFCEQKKVIAPDQRGMIDNLMDNFNFRKVAKVMWYLKWTWIYCDWEDQDSIEPDLRKKAREMLEYLFLKDEEYTSSGGFEATLIEGNLRLRFIVTDWEEPVVF